MSLLVSQAFSDFFTKDIAAHARYVDGLRYAIGRGLGRYILENHYDDLVAMFKPLLENHRSDELADCARIINNDAVSHFLSEVDDLTDEQFDRILTMSAEEFDNWEEIVGFEQD